MRATPFSRLVLRFSRDVSRLSVCDCNSVTLMCCLTALTRFSAALFVSSFAAAMPLATAFSIKLASLSCSRLAKSLKSDSAV